MAAPVVASVASGNGQSNYAVSVPTGTTNGDLLIAVAASDWGTFAGNGVPTGFTALSTSSYNAGTDAYHIAIGYRIASSEPATYTFPVNGSADHVGAILRITGADSTPTIVQVAPSTSGNGTTAPSLTPNGSDDLLITVHSGEFGGNTVTWTAPAGMTEQVDGQSTTWTSMEICSLQSPSTPSGTKTAVPSASPLTTGAGCAISIKALGGGTGATATPAKTTTTVAVPQATPSAGSTKTPAVTTAVVAAPQATPAVSDSGAPAATAAVVAMLQAAPSGNATVTPAPIAVAVAVPQTAVSVATGPAALTATVAVPQATPQTAGNVTASPAAVSAIVGAPAATPSGAATASPAVVAAVAALPQASPIAGGNVTRTPSPVAVVAGLPAATPVAAGVVSPGVIVTVVAVPRPALGVVAGPSSIAVLAALPVASPVTSSSVTRTPVTVAVVAGVPRPSAFAEGEGVRGRLGELSARLPGGVVAPETFESGGTIR